MKEDSLDKYDLLQGMLIAARLKARLKQADVAAKLGKPQSYISKVERGERGIDIIEYLAIAEVIGFDPVAFLDELTKRSA